MSVTAQHIVAATAILNQIAFSGGEDADPTVTLAAWRASEGFDDEVLEAAARESARESVEEIEQLIAEGGSLTMAQLGEYLEREYLTALQIGWIVRARVEIRARAEKVDGH